MVKKYKPPKKPNQTPLNKTDKRVWDTVKKTVKPIEHQPNQMETLLSDYMDTEGLQKNTPAVNAPLKHSAFQQAVGGVMQKIAHNNAKLSPNITIDRVDDLQHGDISNVHKSQGKRFLRGQLPVEASLDLHGMTQDRAYERLHQFIKQAYGRGLRKVIVVTGKGQGILKNQTPRWLNDPSLRPFILSFSYAQPRDGGDGALYVLIRKNK